MVGGEVDYAAYSGKVFIVIRLFMLFVLFIWTPITPLSPAIDT
jgi:hypothetical protein